MLKFLADEDFNRRIVRGIRRKLPELDIARVQDVGLSGTPDPDLLEWAANENRLLLTHDASTMAGFAYDRVTKGKNMPGVVEVSQNLAIGLAIEQIIFFAACSLEGEWQAQVIFIPLK